ncbi:MAG: biopolymer transporter ExbD [Candidatus Pedobacter colombiensis]|uniref:Biopolymer transporter ExbD n=1 Tax=Candidatus Pedobacter colombiensis TaxID=3121371 RepID=A0AAJ5W329_9SPHI|nr:biopolymer transporter ExbD [Pedobacter sp.]WEK17588.1 MAG: biopolymer transporter ExbD [Pedobacter sp.]
MAELNVSPNRRAVPKVDLTAMVDLAFLLITFFMLTTSLSKPVAMDVVKPDEPVDDIQEPVPASRSMTILLGKDNKVAWYMGEAGKSQPVIESIEDVRQSILKNKMKVDAVNVNNPKKSLFVIIKPTAGAHYKNFVDILDELKVVGITAAPAIDDDHITKEEQDFMKQQQLL